MELEGSGASWNSVDDDRGDDDDDEMDTNGEDDEETFLELFAGTQEREEEQEVAGARAEAKLPKSTSSTSTHSSLRVRALDSYGWEEFFDSIEITPVRAVTLEDPLFLLHKWVWTGRFPSKAPSIDPYFPTVTGSLLQRHKPNRNKSVDARRQR